MNFIFNRLSFAHGGAALLAALTLGLACLFGGFNAGADNLNAGADNDDECKKCAEQSAQEDACEKIETADNDVIHLYSYGFDEAFNLIMELEHSVKLMLEADIEAASITRRPDKNAVVQQK